MSTPTQNVDTGTPDDQRGRGIKGRTTHVIQRVQSGTAGKLWDRLNAADFMNSAFQFSALALLCLFPFIIIVSAALGGDGRRVIISRLGLSPQAAHDVDNLISSGHQALVSLTVSGIIFLLLSGIAIASTLQAWYQKLYEVEPPTSWLKQSAIRLVWLASTVVNVSVLALVGLQTGPAGGRLLIFVCEFAISLLFWWWSLYLLLLGQKGWSELFPAALATAVCLTGLGVFSALLFSNSIVSDVKSYGSIGVVMVLLSWCIGFGVVLHLGAVIGRMWNERGGGEAADGTVKVL
jgi:membrane protein